MTDFHSHCLPHMDDGADNIDIGISIITSLQRQGVDRVIATPHYYPNAESIESFVERRTTAFNELSKKFVPIPILLGAEVALTQQLSRRDNLSKLLIDSRKYILLELPDMPYCSWMSEEICNIAYGLSAIPIIAHIDRCFEEYSNDELVEILSIPSAIFQISCDALLNPKSSRLALKLIKYGYPVILGSDAHDMNTRAPHFKESFDFIGKKLNKSDYTRFLDVATEFIAGFNLSKSEPTKTSVNSCAPK